MGGKFTFPGGGYYHATKHAVESLSDALRFEVRGFGVDVIIIEPGLIRSELGGTVASAIAENTVAGGPYGAFNARVATSSEEVYEKGPLARLGGTPDSVAKAIEKAISARRPRARYLVTASARAMVMPHALLPDRAWDAFLRSQFFEPGKE
jgi:NAD(P)-dependent dehydrogenase (short-subunit alcohol dehydrogenase family)